MALLKRLDIQAIVRALGLRNGSPPGELSEILQPIFDVRDYLTPDEGVIPAPVPIRGMQRLIHIGTAAFNIAAAANTSGVLNVFGGGVVVPSVPVPAGIFSNFPTPPTAPWELWGAEFFFGTGRGNIVEGNVQLQITPGITATEDTICYHASDHHALNGYFEAMQTILLPKPFVIPAAQQIYLKYQVVNLDGVNPASVDLQAHIFWAYA